MNKYIKHISLCLSVMLLCACENADRDGMSASLEYREMEVNKHELKLNADGTGKETFKIESKNAVWSVETPDAWIHVDAQHGDESATISVTADENKNPDSERKGVIIVKSDVTGWNFVDTVKVTQSSATHYAKAEMEEYEFPAAGGERIITIDANADWKASVNSSWVKLEQLNRTQLKVIVEPTTEWYSRNTTVYLQHGSSYSTSSFTIKQAAPTVKAEQSVYEIPASGGELIIPVSADISWIATPYSKYCDWITLEKVSCTQLKAVVKSTTSTNSRTATIDLKSEASSYTMSSFSIEQDGGSVSVSETECNFTKDGGSADVIIDANTDWTVEIANTTWISVSKAKGEAGRTTITITADKTSSYRTSYVYLKIGNTRVKTIYVKQQ